METHKIQPPVGKLRAFNAARAPMRAPWKPRAARGADAEAVSRHERQWASARLKPAGVISPLDGKTLAASTSALAMDYATSAGAFVVALAVNAALGGSTGELSARASRAAVEAGGLNPNTVTFSIWGVFYAIFLAAYAWALPGQASFPTPLAAAWVANAAWMILSSREEWSAALVTLPVYAACMCLALPALTGAGAAGPLQLAGVASAGLVLWLLVATLLNTQLVVPAWARTLRPLAVPLVCLVALGLAGGALLARGAWALARAVFVCGVTAWIVAGALGKLGGPRLGSQVEAPAHSS